MREELDATRFEMLDRRRTLRVLCSIVLPAYAVLLGTFWLPLFPLDGLLAAVAYWVSESGGTRGLPLVASAMLLALALRTGALGLRRRLLELITALGVAGAALGGGAWANEHLIKVALAVPRPDIIELSRRGALGKTPAQFYALGDKAARSRYLARALRLRAGKAPRLSPRIRAHWISETGYSFPSGHSFASMLALTIFLGLGLSLTRGVWRFPFFLLVPWALAVCISRPILRVHSPIDVSVGAAEGIVVGLLALLVLLAFYRHLEHRPA